MTTFTKNTLLRMNSDSRYGYGWIKNLERMGDHEEIKIYPTGESTLATGRVYIAFPAKQALTQRDILQYNILFNGN
jgi:hypothetical protein